MRLRIIAFIGIAALASACTGDASRDRVAVVATTTQLGAAAAAIGGEEIDLTVLLQPGAEAHDFELTPAGAAAIEDADLILRSGAGLDGWLDDALETIGDGAALRDMSEGVSLRQVDPDHTEEDGEDDHGSEADPHYWLSGPNAIQMVANVRDALVSAVPAHEAAFEDRAAALIERLETVDAEIRALIAEVPQDRRGIVTNHDAFGYFIDEYGLRFVGSIFPSLDVEAEPSAGQLADLIDTLRAENVVAIFSESAVNPELARAVAEEAGAVVVEEPLYTDSLGAEGSGAETLDGMLRHNAQVVHDALIGS